MEYLSQGIYWTNLMSAKEMMCRHISNINNPANPRKILVKVGISAVSIEGAKKNLEAEIPGWDFDQVRKTAQSAWVKELCRSRSERWQAG